MNQFKSLDAYFPVLPDRRYGEVVSVSVQLIVITPWGKYPSDADIYLSWKRKAWYVNASTNAFILHRNLCREYREAAKRFNISLPNSVYRTITKSLATAVYESYMEEGKSDQCEQYYNWEICIRSNPETNAPEVILCKEGVIDPEQALWELVPYSFEPYTKDVPLQ